MDIMTNEEIAEFYQKLRAIQTTHGEDFQKQANSLFELQKSIGLNLPVVAGNPMQAEVLTLTSGIHNYLQTNMMLNACVSAEASSDLAKRSCKWAAIAAIAACISAVLTCLAICLTVYLK
jgi:hypothetical protein